MRPPLVTLSTDIGPVYSAQMKAVLLAYVGPDRIVELSHDLPAHRIGEAAFLLRHMAAGYPSGTIHVAVVDPGVGGVRAPIAVRCRDGTHLVGPDNGVLSPLARHLGIGTVIRLDPERVRPGAPVSATFEGRDLFAPAAGRLAQGTSIGRLGARTTLRPYELPEARRGAFSASGIVLHVDHFGNLITNIPVAWGPSERAPSEARIGRRRARLMRYRTYEGIPLAGAGVVASSFGVLEISVREGRASDRFRARTGTSVALRWRPRQQGRK